MTLALHWSPLILGEALTLRIALPASATPDQIRLALPRLSHFFRLPFTEPRAAETEGCHEAPACHPAWDGPSRATALLLHTDETGGTGVCTGTLLNDADPDTYIPYLLTAHHCVSDQARASSIEAYWFVRSATCGGEPDGHEVVSGGADLLDAAKSTDTSFLRLRRPPPAGAVFAGWSATLPAEGQAVVGVHQPGGGLQAIAFGTVAEHLNCEDIDYCGEDADHDGVRFVRVEWAQGVTLAGSSGSGLFLPGGELVGVLSGGFGECGEQGGPDDYGRFDVAYRAGLDRWLGSGRE